MVQIRKNEEQQDIYYFEETIEEKIERETREGTKKKNKDKSFDKLTRAEKDELLLALVKIHNLT